MIYRSIDARGARSYSLATSPDGMKWWKFPDRPVVQGTGWDTFLGSGTLLWHNNNFRLWHTSNSDGSSFWYLRTAISDPVVLSVGSDPTLRPACFALEQNYPNPFNPTTVIRANVPSDGRITIAVFDILGQAVDVLLDDVRPAGTYEVSFNGSDKASGMYFYRLTAGGMTTTKKMMLSK
jgi:N-methylhydantoinase B/oxoprolinase/acetone carboxylase alpha subunit